VYLRWNLGEFVAVRHPLFRQGLPLQKTMQNRAGDRCDVFLSVVLDWVGLGWIGLDWVVLCCVVLDWVGFHCIPMLINSFNYSLTFSLSFLFFLFFLHSSTFLSSFLSFSISISTFSFYISIVSFSIFYFYS
jgi:hypothetical protein